MKTLSQIIQQEVEKFESDSEVYKKVQYEINKFFDHAGSNHCAFCGFSVKKMSAFLESALKRVAEQTIEGVKLYPCKPPCDCSCSDVIEDQAFKILAFNPKKDDRKL